MRNLLNIFVQFSSFDQTLKITSPRYNNVPKLKKILNCFNMRLEVVMFNPFILTFDTLFLKKKKSYFLIFTFLYSCTVSKSLHNQFLSRFDRTWSLCLWLFYRCVKVEPITVDLLRVIEPCRWCCRGLLQSEKSMLGLQCCNIPNCIPEPPFLAGRGVGKNLLKVKQSVIWSG